MQIFDENRDKLEKGSQLEARIEDLQQEHSVEKQKLLSQIVEQESNLSKMQQSINEYSERLASLTKELSEHVTLKNCLLNEIEESKSQKISLIEQLQSTKEKSPTKRIGVLLKN